MSKNMAYCRFENTLNALKECRAAIREGLVGSSWDEYTSELSDTEWEALGPLIELCGELSSRYGGKQ